MTVRELADEVHVSTATVMRFAEKQVLMDILNLKWNSKCILKEETKKKQKEQRRCKGDTGVFL